MAKREETPKQSTLGKLASAADQRKKRAAEAAKRAQEAKAGEGVGKDTPETDRLSESTPEPESESTAPDPDEFVRMNITMRRRERDQLDAFVRFLVSEGEIPDENKSFVIRRALRHLYRQYGF